jgi:para-nitrobenzyl esterase
LGAVGPVVDGRLLPRSVTQTFASGDQIHVPLIIGSNSYEASLMKSFGLPSGAMLKLLPPAMRALYPADDDAAASAVFTDAVMGGPARWIAGRASQGGAPAWLYRFDYVPTARRGQTPGTTHGGEIPFVFATWSELAGPMASAEDQAMERLAHGCWVAFAKLGRPDCGARPWPVYDPASDTLMGFGVTTAPATGVRKAQDDVLQRVFLPRMTAGS